MSVTFFIAEVVDGITKPSYRCDCSTRWCDACDAAWAKGEDAPDQFSCENCDGTEMNLSNSNAEDFISWLGLEKNQEDYLYGKMNAREVAARCRRRLWDEARNHDPALSPEERAEALGVAQSRRVIIAGRSPGYLRSKTEEMLRLCEKAGDRMIVWS